MSNLKTPTLLDSLTHTEKGEILHEAFGIKSPINPLTEAQTIALSACITVWPLETAFETIIELIRNEDHAITVWDMMEDWDSKELSRHIDSLAQDIQEAINKAIERTKQCKANT